MTEQIIARWGSVDAFVAVMEAFKATSNLYNNSTMRDINALGDALKRQGFVVAKLEEVQIVEDRNN